MFSSILAFFGTAGGHILLGSGGLMLLGLFAKSLWYRKIRESIGRSAMAGGVALSALGNSKLKLIWDPVENVLADFLGFATEQFFVGLRKDNAAKLEAHVERLQDAGSEVRAAALAGKVQELRAAQVGRAAEKR